MASPVLPAGAARPSERLAELGLVLPAVPTPAGAYLPAVRDGELVWTAGQLPLVDGSLAATGLVGDQISAERAAELARVCALNALAAAAGAAGGLDALARIVKVVGFVASAPGFTAQPAVVNGASELLAAVFGDAGRHARSAVGVAALPLGAPVEIELVARVAG
ncbi:putative translation initiation inhibitor, yjgF family [Frankia sp. EI5c]|uniref:RidA family protein n=1 Tax=Frankia sp. EI5c TaxID=683316 RepID=UPI0007C2D969|nr:RidA family protein [Frankia sp. EI5c]OAA27041.1 putative translation initiation inhibitor, yjgF family [Frankia sp. EI5c]